MERSVEYYQELVHSLAGLPTEVEWAEFKVNNQDPERIAKYISAMSNEATLCDRAYGYVVWGIKDDTHEIVGTKFEYRKAKKGNMELELWLNKHVNPKIEFKFHEVPFKNAVGEPIHVTLIEIPCAEGEPTKYESNGYVRVGSNLQSLIEYPEKEAELWRKFDKTPYERRIAYFEATDEDVVTLLDYPGYYRKIGAPIPANRENVLKDLSDEKFIHKNDGGTWDISNYGALMIAADLNAFDNLAKRSVRIIRYSDKSRIGGIGEKTFYRGYAISFEEIIQYILMVIPQEEFIESGIRRQKYRFPEMAIRELLANVLVHQSLEQKGTSPMVEIFSDRIEFSNAGAPLVAIERIVDTVPLSRNENMAESLIAPKVEKQNNQFTKVTLYSKIDFDMTTKEDRVRTCYMIACLAFVTSDAVTNTVIRKAFGLDEKEKVKASRIIRDTLEAKLIKPVDPTTAPRYMRYVPFWA